MLDRNNDKKKFFVGLASIFGGDVLFYVIGFLISVLTRLGMLAAGVAVIVLVLRALGVNF